LPLDQPGRGLAALLAESLWLSVGGITPLGLRLSGRAAKACEISGKAKPFRKEGGQAADLIVLENGSLTSLRRLKR